MEKGNLLRTRGKLLCFADFARKNTKVNESIVLDVTENGLEVQFDGETVDLIWAEIMGQSNGGDVETLKKFIADNNNVRLEYIGERQIIEHIMSLVDQRLNNEVVARGDFQHILGFEKFAEKAKRLDYIFVVETLISRLYGYEKEGGQESKFVPLILDIMNNHTDLRGEENEENIDDDLPF